MILASTFRTVWRLPRRFQHRHASRLPPRVAIVGSGPAGFYTAHRLLNKSPDVAIDMFERLPTPFGLVRYGVAPDHPEVKNVANTFSQIAQNPRFSFFGNVAIGRDVNIADLQQTYNAVVMASGSAAGDVSLNIPGEWTLKNIFPSRHFVGWYNGHPDFAKLSVDLESTDTAVVLGMGNVALDVARLLLSPIDVLRMTDIAPHALDALARSRIRRVRVVARRGPVQAAFTAKELREMLKLPDTRIDLDSEYLTSQIEQHKATMDRARSRLMGILTNGIEATPKDANRSWSLDFSLTPREFLGTNVVAGVRAQRNDLIIDESGSVRAVPRANDHVDLECGLVVKALGYRAVAIPGAPPVEQGVVRNQQGRVLAPGFDRMYVAGWLKTGPTGVIASTMRDAYETADTILQDLRQNSNVAEQAMLSAGGVGDLLRRKGVPYVDWTGWERIRDTENARGSKIASVEEMVAIARGQTA